MSVDVNMIFILMVVFQIKHYICDFPLQTTNMVIMKQKAGWEFFIPLLQHAGVHAIFTLAMVLYINPKLWWLSVVDIAIHFAMDRMKASPFFLGKLDDTKMRIFGFDQMVHHLTHIYIVYALYIYQ